MALSNDSEDDEEGAEGRAVKREDFSCIIAKALSGPIKMHGGGR